MKHGSLNPVPVMALTAFISLIVIAVFEWVDEIIWPNLSREWQEIHLRVFIPFICCVAAFYIHRYLKTRSVMVSIIGSSEDGIVGLDPKCTIVTWNPAAKRIYGFSQEDVRGKPVAMLVQDGLSSQMPAMLEKVLHGEPVGNVETMLTRPDGREIDLSLTISPIRNESGQVSGISMIVRDITERKGMERKIRQSENLLRRVIDNTGAMVCLLTPQGIVVELNLAALSTWNLKLEDVLGKDLAACDWFAWSPVSQERLREAIAKSSRGGRSRYDETIRLGTDTYVAVDFSIAPLRESDGALNYLIASAYDITARKAMEGELRSVRDELEQIVARRTDELQAANAQLKAQIAEIQRAQNALQSERDRFMGILEAMGDGVYVTNPDHQIQYLNPVIEREFGPPAGKKCHEYFDGRSDQCPRCANQSVFGGKTVRWAWTSVITGKTYDSFATPIQNPDGTTSKLEIFRDVTEQKHNETALRESENRYRMLFNQANDAVYTNGLTPKGEFTPFIEFNDNLCAITGFDREEMARKTLADLLSPQSFAAVLSAKRALFGTKHLVMEGEIVCKDGKKTAVEISSHLFDYRGQPTVLSIARNIEERKRSEEVLRLSEKKYRKLSQEFDTLLNAIDDRLVLLSPDLTILWSNDPAVRQSGSFNGGTRPPICHEVFFCSTEPCNECPVLKCFRTGENETSISSGSGSFLDKRAFPIKDGDQVVSVILLVSDITEKMMLQAEAMHATHLSSVGELAAGVAHEINNPINGIINYAQILINECSSEALSSDIAKRVLKESERIAYIVRSLLSFSRGGGEDKSSVNLQEVYNDTLVLVQAQLRRESIRMEARFPDDLPAVKANFQQLQQVFLNILNNARYALNEKYPGRHDDKRIEIQFDLHVDSARRYVRVAFLDHGNGIPESNLTMIKKPFFSTKPFGKGTGLGLSIVDRIVADHGGRLDLESAEGRFTRVVVALPAED